MERIKIRLTTAILCLLFTLPVFAQNTRGIQNLNESKATNGWVPARLYLGAYGGYGDVSGGYKNDGQVTQGRLAFGARILDYKCLSFGAEAGVQSGNDMRLSAASSLISEAGGLPIQTTLKPLMDLVVAVKGKILPNHPLFGILKGGVAYRQLQLNGRSSYRDGLQRVNGEVQVGLGYSVTDHAMFTVFYQGIYSGANAGVSLNSIGDITIKRIPTQQAGFIGFEYFL